jgi:hypothetical protein
MAFVDLCRLCGTNTLDMEVRNAIFEGGGRAKKYAQKMSVCLSIKVLVAIFLPLILQPRLRDFSNSPYAFFMDLGPKAALHRDAGIYLIVFCR